MFKTTFYMSEEDLEAEHVDLVFDGLDTFAIIKLVGLIIKTISCRMIQASFPKNNEEILR